MKVFVSSLGCDKNLSDTEHMLALLADAGFTFTDIPEEADVILVNTCCFIGDAKEESIQEILTYGKLKEEGILKALVVTGCLSERYQEELEENLPEIDGCLGISSWNRIVEVVQEALKGRAPHVFDDHNLLCTTGKRLLTTGGHYAYLKIAEGCDKNCTYCVIPSVRGHYRSIPMEDLLEEAKALVEGGVRELILVAQETTLYGTDLYGEKMLPKLLTALEQLEDLEWIRLLYCYPEEITDELIDTLKKSKKVVHYLDIPIQHASDEILRRMNRRTRKEELKERIAALRKALPDICLRTTLITGFPGETEEEFAELQEFVEEMRFERLGVFPYSREENTPAAAMKPQVPVRTRKKRRDLIMAAQQAIAFANGEKMIGRTLKIMVEGRVTEEEDLYVGRSYMDAPEVDGFVFFTSPYELVSGAFVFVKITSSREYDLIGELTE